MLSFLNKAPVIKEKNMAFRIILPILSFITSIFVFAPVITGFKWQEAVAGYSPVHLVFKGLFGISLIACSIIYAFTKNVPATGVAAIFGFISALFPLLRSVSDCIQAKNFSEQFSMTTDYSPYLISICVYLLLAMLCLSTALYSAGLLPYPIIILVLSAITLLAVLFVTIERVTALSVNIFEVICFAYAAFAVSIPVLFVLSVRTRKSIEKEQITESTEETL